MSIVRIWLRRLGSNDPVVITLVFVGMVGLLSTGCSDVAKVRRHLTRASDYFHAQRYDEASIEYRNVLRIQPTNGPALSRLALIRHHQGNLSQASVLLPQAAQLQPEDPEIRLRLGQVHFATRDYEKAGATLQHVLSRTPTNLDALALAVEVAAATNGVANLRQWLEERREQIENSPGYQAALASILMREGDLRTSEEAANRALKLEASAPSIHALLGTLELAKHDAQQAGEHFKRAADLSPKRSPERLRYADFLIRTGRASEGRDYLIAMTKEVPDFLSPWVQLGVIAFDSRHYDEAIGYLTKVTQQDPYHLNALMLSGRVRLAQGNGEKAAALFQRLAEMYPKVPGILYYLATAQLQQEDTAAARGSLNRAIALSPNFSEAAVLLAQINARMGNYDLSIPPLRSLIAKNPGYLPAYSVLAEAHRSQGNLPEAVRVYKRLGEQQPTNAEIPALIGLLHKQQNQTREARTAFETSLRLRPDYLMPLAQLVDMDIDDKNYTEAQRRVEARMAASGDDGLVHLLAAKLYLAQNDYERAEQSAGKAIQLNPELTIGYDLLAQIHLKSGRLDEALVKLETVITKDPKDARALFVKGIIHDGRKEYPAARSAYERILEINPKNPYALNNLALLYANQFGDPELGLKLAHTAHSLQPTNAAIAETLGSIYFIQRKYDLALPLFQQSIGATPEDSRALYQMGASHYMLAQEGPAEGSLQRAASLQADPKRRKEFPGQANIERLLSILRLDAAVAPIEAATTLKDQLSQHPEDIVALTKLGQIQERAGNIPDAIKTYEVAASSGPRGAKAMIRLAKLLAGPMRDLEGGLRLAKKARDASPTDPDAGQILGELAYQVGDHMLANSVLADVLKTRPEDGKTLYHLAYARMALGQLAESSSLMQSALTKSLPSLLEIQGRETLRLLGFLKAIPNPGEAADAAKAALARDPNDLLALYLSAHLAEQAGNVEAAKRAYEAILAPGHFPRFFPANKALAGVLLKEGNHAKAAQYAAVAREQFPNDPETALILGICAFHRNEYSYSAALLESSARALSTNAQAFYYLALAYHRLKRPSDAHTAFQNALARGLDANLAADAKRILAEAKPVR